MKNYLSSPGNVAPLTLTQVPVGGGICIYCRIIKKPQPTNTHKAKGCTAAFCLPDPATPGCAVAEHPQQCVPSPLQAQHHWPCSGALGHTAWRKAKLLGVPHTLQRLLAAASGWLHPHPEEKTGSIQRFTRSLIPISVKILKTHPFIKAQSEFRARKFLYSLGILGK